MVNMEEIIYRNIPDKFNTNNIRNINCVVIDTILKRIKNEF